MFEIYETSHMYGSIIISKMEVSSYLLTCSPMPYIGHCTTKKQLCFNYTTFSGPAFTSVRGKPAEVSSKASTNLSKMFLSEFCSSKRGKFCLHICPGKKKNSIPTVRIHKLLFDIHCCHLLAPQRHQQSQTEVSAASCFQHLPSKLGVRVVVIMYCTDILKKQRTEKLTVPNSIKQYLGMSCNKREERGSLRKKIL